jgi:hypothetical protein
MALAQDNILFDLADNGTHKHIVVPDAYNKNYNDQN